jgi:EF hand
MQSRIRAGFWTSKLAMAGAVVAMSGLWAQAQAQTQAPDLTKQPPTAAGPSGSTPADLFAKADTNHDGKLSREESKMLPAISEKFDILDKDKDGSLNVGEFTAGVKAAPVN